MLPVSVRHAQAFAPQGPARVLVALLAAAVDAGADPAGLVLRDWNGWVAAEAPGANPELAMLAIAERLPDAARIRTAPLPGPAEQAPELDLGRARGTSGLAVLAKSVGAHPVEVAIALAAHGQPLEIAADDPDMVRNVRNWGLSGDPLPEDPTRPTPRWGSTTTPAPGAGTLGGCCSGYCGWARSAPTTTPPSITCTAVSRPISATTRWRSARR